MMNAFVDHPIFQAAVVFILTIIGKIVYDRWFSTRARVTPAMCELSQKACRDAIVAQMTLNNTIIEKTVATHTVRLKEGEDCFETERHIQRAVLVTLLAICNHLKVPCDALTKVMVDADILK